MVSEKFGGALAGSHALLAAIKQHLLGGSFLAAPCTAPLGKQRGK